MGVGVGMRMGMGMRTGGTGGGREHQRPKVTHGDADARDSTQTGGGLIGRVGWLHGNVGPLPALLPPPSGQLGQPDGAHRVGT